MFLVIVKILVTDFDILRFINGHCVFYLLSCRGNESLWIHKIGYNYTRAYIPPGGTALYRIHKTPLLNLLEKFRAHAPTKPIFVRIAKLI